MASARRVVAQHLDRVWIRGRFDRAASPDLTVAIVDGRLLADVFGLREAIGAILADTR